MNLAENIENLQQYCRICLQNGDLNIWHCKIALKTTDIAQTINYEDSEALEKSFMELINIFHHQQDLLNLCEEFPLICWQCLEELKFCYLFYEKLKSANIQLKNLYQDSLNQCIEEEHLIEEKDLAETQEIIETNVLDNIEEGNVTNLTLNSNKNYTTLPSINQTIPDKQISVNKNDAFVITQFVASAIEPSERETVPQQTKEEDEEGANPPPLQQLLTINLKAVEVRDFQNLENLHSPSDSNLDSSSTPAVYVCQYCPQAFAKSDYLKTHIHKSHVCKFCTQPFSITEELFKHIREVHTEHKCAICHKLLSSHTNLRHHIKRVHRIKLPAKVMLLDFIKSKGEEDNIVENQEEFLQEELETANKESNIQYIWKNDDCIEMFTEVNESEMN
ncbi:uncharacterized protein ACRADG_006246 [Cochliomyia hominivorax]